MRDDMRCLLDEYCRSLSLVRRAARRAAASSTHSSLSSSTSRDFDRQQLASMESDLEWTIEYMVTGFEPRVSTGPYRQTLPVDPQRVLARLAAPSFVMQLLPSEVARRMVLAALDILSPQERECYLMVVGEGLSYSETARMLGVSKRTVQTHVKRTREKIVSRKETVEHTFCRTPSAYK